MIQLSTFFSGLGITGGNTQSSNFYDFWYGIEFSGGTITYNITDFMSYLGTTRYEFFKSLNSEYPDVWDEYTFYQNIDDVRIYDFYTFYTYAGEYLGGSPSPTFQSWYGIGDGYIQSCSSTPDSTFYSTGSTIQIGDIIYTDSDLTTPLVGGGVAYEFAFVYPLNPIQAPLFTCYIDTDGSIISFTVSCPANFQFASGNTSNDACSSLSYDFSLNTSTSVGDQVWLITPDNITPTKFELFEGNNLFYQYDELGIQSYIQVSNNGEVIDNGSCPTPTPTVTPTNTPTTTPTVTPTNTPTTTPTNTPTITPTNTITPTITPTNTITPTPTYTPYVSPNPIFSNISEFVLVATGSTTPAAGEIVFNNANACYDPKTTIMRISYTDRLGVNVESKVKSYTGATGSTVLFTNGWNNNGSPDGPQFSYQTTSFTDYGTYLELVHTVGSGTCADGVWIIGSIIQLQKYTP
jgi:hypothetical protein